MSVRCVDNIEVAPNEGASRALERDLRESTLDVIVSMLAVRASIHDAGARCQARERKALSAKASFHIFVIDRHTKCPVRIFRHFIPPGFSALQEPGPQIPAGVLPHAHWSEDSTEAHEYTGGQIYP